MPYALKLYLYLGVGFVVAVVVSDQWLRHRSSTIVLGFGATYAGLVIAVVGGCLGGKLCRGCERSVASYRLGAIVIWTIRSAKATAFLSQNKLFLTKY
jgi:hypothetical protein